MGPKLSKMIIMPVVIECDIYVVFMLVLLAMNALKSDRQGRVQNDINSISIRSPITGILGDIPHSLINMIYAMGNTTATIHIGSVLFWELPDNGMI